MRGAAGSWGDIAATSKQQQQIYIHTLETQTTQLAVRFIQTGGAVLARVVDQTREHRRLAGVALEPAVTAALAVEAGAAVQAATRRQRRRTLGVKVNAVVDEIALATVVANVAGQANMCVCLAVAGEVTGAVIARETRSCDRQLTIGSRERFKKYIQ